MTEWERRVADAFVRAPSLEASLEQWVFDGRPLGRPLAPEERRRIEDNVWRRTPIWITR
jgi:hypothetical protein